MINDFFTYPMRIFFLSACVVGIIACVSFFVADDFISYHKFIFLSLLSPAAYAGFLLTALPDWANYEGNLKPHSLFLFGVFLSALLLSFFSINLAAWTVCIFWIYLSFFGIYMLWLGKNDDNFSIASVLIGFCIFSVLFAFNTDEKYINLQIHLNIVAISVVVFRVAMVLAKEALKRENFKDAIFVPNFVSKNLTVIAIACYMFAYLFDLSNFVLGFCAFGVAFLIFSRLYEWHIKALLKHDFVLIYYGLNLISAIGYAWLGYSHIFATEFISNALHVIAIGVFLGVIMLIFNVAGLRHSGLELEFPKLSLIAFLLIFLAVTFRSMGTIFSYNLYILAPTICLIIAFVCYFLKFFQIFKDNEFSPDPE